MDPKRFTAASSATSVAPARPSASGALRFPSAQARSPPRLRSRSGSGVMALTVEVRWLDPEHGACFVGVRFVESRESDFLLRDLLIA